MSDAGKRLIESAKQALEFAQGNANIDEYRVHQLEEDNQNNTHKLSVVPTTSPQKVNQHVVKRDTGWAVRAEGQAKDTIVKPTQREAIQYAKQIAQNSQSEVVIHGRDGRIRERKNYSLDHRSS